MIIQPHRSTGVAAAACGWGRGGRCYPADHEADTSLPVRARAAERMPSLLSARGARPRQMLLVFTKHGHGHAAFTFQDVNDAVVS
jgi:hypothetical protein